MMRFVLASIFYVQLLSGVCHFKSPETQVDKVDLVYTWVDGGDKEWQASFQQRKKGQKVCHEACLPSRFKSHDELKYSLRSVWKYASFINHIYIVTANQKPSWLIDHPKITIVNHSEIFYNQSHLPTFNSQAIEANLHHIPNLAECYIYFNDDVFLGKRVRVRDFFSKSGKPKIFLASWPSPDGPIDSRDASFTASWKNSNAFLNRLFGYKKRRALEHAPFAFRRSQLLSLEECMPVVFKTASRHPFRSLDDYLITAGLSQYFLDNYGHVQRSKIEAVVIGLKDDLETNRKALKSIGHPTTFCIQDAMERPTPEQDKLIREFLESRFPDPAPWEG